MHKYEVMFIVRPDLSDEEIDKIVSQMEGYVLGAGAKMERIEKLGRRRLAYRVRQQMEGFYIRFIFESDPPAVGELERRMKVTDAVIKFLSIRVDEDQKRAARQARRRARSVPKERTPKPSQAVAPPATGNQTNMTEDSNR